MLGAIMFMVQTVPAAAPPLPAAGPVLPKALIVAARCNPSDEDIVVCGKTDPEQYRLRPLGDPPNGRPLPPMTAKLGNGTIDSHAEEKCVGGFCAPALMARFKVPF